MVTITPNSESIMDIVKAVEKQTSLLPEFQRDFRWQLDRTYELFDSMAKDIFIGTIIYGKPSFAISCRQFDARPRSGRGSRKRFETISLDEAEAKARGMSNNFRLVLDGQQRITSIYRAVKGIDQVFLVLAENPEHPDLEGKMETFAGVDREDRVCIRLSDVYDYETKSLRDNDMLARFHKSRHFKTHAPQWDKDEQHNKDNQYLDAFKQLRNLFNRDKLVSYYMLDMSLDKFCLFFERSNSRGIQLNFTDILAAKLYSGFNLREAVEQFEDDNQDITLNRELVIRAISCLASRGRDIDKSYILKELRPKHFNSYWTEMCDLYARTLRWLHDNHFMLSQSWLPSENMVLPLMMFFRDLDKLKARMNQAQLEFIKLWYWSSVFSNRYTGPSNDLALDDTRILGRIARGDFSIEGLYFRRLRSMVSDAKDVVEYRKKGNSIYKGLLNVINFDSEGLLDWTSDARLSLNHEKLHDHHIFPQAFIRQHYADQPDLVEIVDTVANRALIPKLTNMKIGAKSPSIYLNELLDQNPDLAQNLASHKIPSTILDSECDEMFKEFIDKRANAIFEIVDRVAIQPLDQRIVDS